MGEPQDLMQVTSASPRIMCAQPENEKGSVCTVPVDAVTVCTAPLHSAHPEKAKTTVCSAPLHNDSLGPPMSRQTGPGLGKAAINQLDSSKKATNQTLSAAAIQETLQ